MISRNIILRRLAALVCATAALASTLAVAAYPGKPVRLVVPFAPGGGTDLIARTLAAGMVKELGQQVIIDNKPGAGTIIGTDSVAKSPADGYSIVIATFAHAVNPSMVPKLPFDTSKAFAPDHIDCQGAERSGRASRQRLQVGQGRDRRCQGQARQAELRVAGQRHFGSSGRRDVHQPGQDRDDPRAVPRRGPGHHRPAWRSGRHDLRHGGCSGELRRKRQAQGHRRHLREPLRSAQGRCAIAQDVAGYQVESWYGLYAPAGTPADVIARLNAAATKAAASPDFSRKIEQEGLSIVASDPAALDRFVRTEEVRWSKIIKENNIKAD